jgi:hypothetical protein
MDTKIHPIFQPIEKRVTWKIIKISTTKNLEKACMLVHM